jgi:hypothetical protein
VTDHPLFDLLDSPPSDTIQAHFERWLAENPAVYGLFLRAARELKAAGRRHYGAKALAEWIRHHTGVVTTGEPWKINNNYTSRLARKLLEDHPEEFTGFLELRRLKRE